MNAGVSGMFIIPMGVVATVASLSIAKKPIVRLPLMVCCSAMVAVGMLLACTSSAGMVVLPLTASAVAGLVLGLSMSTSQTVLYRRAASEHIGTSSGLLRTSIYIGSIGASSLSGVFFGETVTDGGSTALASQLRFWGRRAIGDGYGSYVAVVREVVRIVNDGTDGLACRIYWTAVMGLA